MAKDTLGYALEDGYIQHWLAAGPQVIPLEDTCRLGSPEEKLDLARNHHQPEAGVEGDPVEYGECRFGQIQERWRYVRTREDRLVDLSAFYPNACYLRAWAYAEIECPSEREVTFLLTTNGPADLWIDGRHAHRQEHFQPRIPRPIPFKIRLEGGRRQLMVRFEQAAERECEFGMALQLVGLLARDGSEDKVVRIPTGVPAPAYRRKLENIFENCHIRQDVYARKEQIMVYLPEGPAVTTPFVIRMQKPEGPIFAEAARNDQGTEPLQKMGFPFQSPEGSYALRFMPPHREYYEKNVRITLTRNFYGATNVYSVRPYGDYPERRGECLKDASLRRNNLFTEMAKMEGGWWKKIDEQTVLGAIGEVRARRAGSVVALCGLLGMAYRYAERGEFPASLREPLAECVLGYRYGEDEPGFDVMEFGAESRRILFPACELLAGQHHPDRVFPNAGLTGKQHLEKGERLALDWLHSRARNGFAEWDSGGAFEEEVLALSTLTSLADNEQVMEMAALVLDKMFFTLAVNSFRGVFGSTHGSASAAQVKTGYREPTSGIARLLWGMGIFNEHVAGPVSLACSPYELPPILAAIAADSPEALWSRERHAGGAGDGVGVNKVTYKTPDFMLCSAQDWNPGNPGCREHVWQATLGPAVTVFSSHPACASEMDARRPNAWSGNACLPRAAQWKDALIAVYRFPDDDWMGMTHAYFPVHGMDEHAIREGWAFGRVQDGYIALKAARGMEFQTGGDNAYRELRSPGSPNIWICQMGRAALDVSFGGFIEKVLAMPVQFDGDRVDLTTVRGDELGFGWQTSFRVNGTEQPLDGFEHYDNPYCRCAMGAPVMEIRHGTDVLRLLFGERGEEAGGTGGADQ
jgi:hypothetical protein